MGYQDDELAEDGQLFVMMTLNPSTYLDRASIRAALHWASAEVALRPKWYGPLFLLYRWTV